MVNGTAFELYHPNLPKLRYGEAVTIAELLTFIAKTHSDYYVGERDVQLQDLLIDIETAPDFWVGSIIKYAARYGAKNGYNRKDLVKAAHYTLMLMWHDLADTGTPVEKEIQPPLVPEPEHMFRFDHLNIPRMKYGESETLSEVFRYILKTYGEHYSGKNGVQVQDLLIASRKARNFYRGCVIKYALRYGMKNGKQRKDLLKVIHYLILWLGLERELAKTTPPTS